MKDVGHRQVYDVGKALICGMAAALCLSERQDVRVLFTAPRKTLNTQPRDRSRWPGPTASTALVDVYRPLHFVPAGPSPDFLAGPFGVDARGRDFRRGREISSGVNV